MKELLSLEPSGGYVGSHTQAGTGQPTVLCLSRRIIYTLINYCENLKINELGSRRCLGYYDDLQVNAGLFRVLDPTLPVLGDLGARSGMPVPWCPGPAGLLSEAHSR